MVVRASHNVFSGDGQISRCGPRTLFRRKGHDGHDFPGPFQNSPLNGGQIWDEDRRFLGCYWRAMPASIY